MNYNELNCGITGHSGVLGSKLLKEKTKLKFFKFKGDITNKKHIGLIGQELEQIFPELVETYSERQGFKNFKGVNYSNLVAPLIEAIKELTYLNASLTERITILENKIS